MSKPPMVNETIPVVYPVTDTSNLLEDYHGSVVNDPYRWLEVDTATEVESWVKSQNLVTQDYLSKIPFRENIRKRYEELFNYTKLSAPRKIGDYYFYYKNDGLQNQAVIYYQKGRAGREEVFIDPNKLSEKGTVSINLLGASRDDRYLAYSQQAAGSDWQEIRVREIATNTELPDRIKWVKFSGADWDHEGFYYSRYPDPKPGMELSDANRFHSVYYHLLGTGQDRDIKVYENPDEPLMNHSVQVTEDGKYLILYASKGTSGMETRFRAVSDKTKSFQVLFPGFENESYVLTHLDGQFIAVTNVHAPNKKVIRIDPGQPGEANWKTLIPESPHLLNSLSKGGKKLFAEYLENATSKIYQFEYDGSQKTEIELPGLGSAHGFDGKEGDSLLFYQFTSFTDPGSIYEYRPEEKKSKPFFQPELKFDPAGFEQKQVWYKSKDGTSIPMFLVYKKGLVLDGNNPCYLYAYGGFNISLSPSFSASRLILLENGGVFAMPNLRGGGEFGEAWHKAGMLEKKQNVFDDFIAAAEYLIAEKYTSREKLAIAGGSNGGLLVGACMTQRPDLFAVAFPAVGVLDMLRYHKFTIGHAWAVEYGSSDVKEQFEYLIKYSPLHNLKAGTRYPSTLITTADHDDRVVPAHSFKFAAALQKAHKGENPTLIRIETDAGHGAGKPTSKIIEEQADIWSFFFYNTNSPVKYMKG
ncbi:MAG TPA: prolyl oligopeptidase family serine peptidase [Saprospiraceae bacterium]|nr:prolyl oligopeptidase family serine peptidase [Saprospiraceae bacterium]HNT18845.1 prolyl oligopeptidase family serine peptidase [Saprospiraceae bacterium]